MKFYWLNCYRFAIGLEVFKWSEHIKDGHYMVGKGVCLSFGLWHLDIYFSGKMEDEHE